jgi:HAD superfamily hydrolase (TIGR01509 family)
MSLKALIFDVDGTLADTERKGHRVAYNRAFEQLGIKWNWSEDTYGELLTVSGGKERMKYFVENYQPEISADSSIDELIADIYYAKTKIFKEMLLTGLIPLRSGVARLFNEAREAGIRLAIATTTAPSNIKYLLTSTLGEESLDWFDIIAAGDIVENKKPSPEIYQLVLKEMGWKAEECVAFEDSENGCLSARGADLPVIITVNAYTRDEPFLDAALVLDQFGDPGDPVELIDDPQGTFDGSMLSIDYLTSNFGQ